MLPPTGTDAPAQGAGRSKWMPLGLVAVASAAAAAGTLWFFGGSPETGAAGVVDKGAGRTVDIAHQAAPGIDGAPAAADAAGAPTGATAADVDPSAAAAADAVSDASADAGEGHAKPPAAAVAVAPSSPRAAERAPAPAHTPAARAPSESSSGNPPVAQPTPTPAAPQTTVASSESATEPAGDPPAPTEPPTPAQQRARLERFRLSVQKKYDFLVERHGSDQVGGIVGELVRAMNSQFDRLIDAPDHYDELHSRLDDLDRLLEERRKAFVH